jgi:hypothetical protein
MCARRVHKTLAVGPMDRQKGKLNRYLSLVRVIPLDGFALVHRYRARVGQR